MYLPQHFNPKDPAAAQALVRDHPLAQVIWTDADGAVQADPIPWLWPEGAATADSAGLSAEARALSAVNAALPGALHDAAAADPAATTPGPALRLPPLLAHAARANPLVQHLLAQDAPAAGFARPIPALLVFSGPQAYVSPSAYPSKAVHHRVVPTWNYAVVQLRGRLAASPQPQDAQAAVAALTAAQEARHPAGERAWSLDDAPADHLQRLLGAICALRFEVQALQVKFKLSQNQSAEDRAGVVGALARGHQPQGAECARWTEAGGPPRTAD